MEYKIQIEERDSGYTVTLSDGKIIYQNEVVITEKGFVIQFKTGSNERLKKSGLLKKTSLENIKEHMKSLANAYAKIERKTILSKGLGRKLNDFDS